LPIHQLGELAVNRHERAKINIIVDNNASVPAQFVENNTTASRVSNVAIMMYFTKEEKISIQF